MCLFRVPSLALCDCAQFSPACLVSLAMAPKTSNGEGAALWRLQLSALAAGSAGRGLTTVAGATGRFRCGVTTIASSRISTTAKSGGNATSTEYTIAHAARDHAEAQPEDYTTFGVDTHTNQGRGCYLQDAAETQPGELATCAAPNRTKPSKWVRHPVPAHWAPCSVPAHWERHAAPPGTSRPGEAQPGGDANPWL